MKISKGIFVKSDFNSGMNTYSYVYVEYQNALSNMDIPLEQRKANAELFAEAGNVANESGLTPRQLLEQRDDLLRVLKLAQPHIYRVAIEKEGTDLIEHIKDILKNYE